MPPTYAAFTEAEHRERLARARSSLREAGFDACICIAPENLYYIGGYDAWVAVNSPQGLVFTPGDDEPTLLLRNVDLALALETAWVRDIRTYHLNRDDPATTLAGILEEKGVRGGRIAVDLQTAAVTGALALALAAALAPARVEDGTLLLGDLRLVKSPAELAYLRRAAHYTQIGLAEARQALRAGRTEIAVAADVEAAMRTAGSDFPAIPTEFATGPRTPGGHATPRPRVIQQGDLAHFEFAGVEDRYHVTGITTLAVGDPGPRAREIHRLNAESLRAGIAAIRPGAPAREVEEASLEPLRRVGLDHLAMMRFGYGIGIAYPPIWLETLQIDRQSDQVLLPGMVFVLHACIELVDEGLGAIQGGTYLLTEAGLEMLAGDGDTDLVTV